MYFLIAIAAVFLGMSVNVVMAMSQITGTLSISNSTLNLGQVEQIKFTTSGGIAPYDGDIVVENSTGTVLAANIILNSTSPISYLTFIVGTNSITFLQPNGSPSGETWQDYAYPTGQLEVVAEVVASNNGTATTGNVTGSLFLSAPSQMSSTLNIVKGGEYDDVLYPGAVSVQYNVTGGIRPYTSWNINISQAYKSGGTWINTYLSGVSGNSGGVYDPSTGTTSYYYNFTYSNTSGILKGLGGKTITLGAGAADSSGQKTSLSGGLVYLDTPMTLSISPGQSNPSVSSNVVNYGSDQTFYANVNGGAGVYTYPYTYQWAYGHSLGTATKVGTGQSYTFYGNATTLSESPLYLFVTANDYYGQKNTSDVVVTVQQPTSAATTTTTIPPTTVSPMHGSVYVSNTTLHANQPEQIKFTVSGGAPPYHYIIALNSMTHPGNVIGVNVIGNPFTWLAPSNGNTFYLNFTMPSTVSSMSAGTYNVIALANDSETPNETTGYVFGSDVTFVESTVAVPTTTTIVPVSTTVAPIPTTTTMPSKIVFHPVTINIQKGWNLLSIPVSEVDDWNAVYDSLSTSCGAFSTYNGFVGDTEIEGGLLWGYENPSNLYVSLGIESYLFNFLRTGTITGTGNIGNMGVLGFWFNSPKQCSINTYAVSGGSYTTNLLAGWNLIGTAEITSAGFDGIASSCNLRGGFYSYDPTTNSYPQATSPTPGEGYFVYANAPCTLNWAATAGSSSPPSAP